MYFVFGPLSKKVGHATLFTELMLLILEYFYENVLLAHSFLKSLNNFLWEKGEKRKGCKSQEVSGMGRLKIL